ncbi:xylose isomerase-like protein [Chaetomium tenue]|uniref:Xylose isomerase-like protein n=1 Tax=Chaetomium tenue TaxID=1854479 RepID=A0ACB7PQJ6_9PEZI|nr:xylose isomerase-like protein [Chaetomium globosum]
MDEIMLKQHARHPVAFASCSLGLPRHTLHQKVEPIREAGFGGIGLSFLIFKPSLAVIMTRISQRMIITCVLDTASKALVLQPFSNFEGWSEGSRQRRDAFARVGAWIDIMDAVGTDLLQVRSSDASDMTRDVDWIYRCWATGAPRWKDPWGMVKKVDRPNIGLCLDTFQTVGGEWGDPTTKAYTAGFHELSKTVLGQKTYFLWTSDAYRLETPVTSTIIPDSGLRHRGCGSHERPLPSDMFKEKYDDDLKRFTKKAMEICKKPPVDSKRNE